MKIRRIAQNFHTFVFFFLYFHSKAVIHVEANPDAKRLYDDLLSNYNRLIRPVVNNTETLTVWLGLKLTQIIEVSLRNQVSSIINNPCLIPISKIL